MGRLAGIPDIEDGTRGEALMLESIAGQPAKGGGVRLQTWNRWTALVPMLVSVAGQEPYRIAPKLWMSRDRYPIAGTVLPVTVDRLDGSNVRIEWDEVPEIEEWIATGHEVFTDPDAVEARLREVAAAHTAGVIHGVDEQTAHAAGPATAFGGPDGVLEAIQRVREAASGSVEQEAPRTPPPTDRPSARVIAMTSPWAEGGAGFSSDEMLLSVLVPGAPRYGVRWRGSIPRDRFVAEWCDLVVEVDPKKPAKVKVVWDEADGVMDAVSQKLAQAGEATAPKSDAELFQALVGDRFGPGGIRGFQAPAPAPDPVDQLARFAKLRDSGAMTEAEFAEAKARLLDRL